MNAVRERVLNGVKPYTEFAEHKDLIAFTVGGEYFSYDCDNDMELELDFCEVIVAVEKDWLFALIEKELAENNDDIQDPLEYLQNEYTWDDSIEWFNEAKEQGKIAVIEFN